MTDKEKAIVMAYTGKCMLTGDKFQIFHKYVEDIMGRPVWTEDIGWLEDEIKEKSKADFMALCKDENEEVQEIDFIQPKKTVGNLISLDVLDKIRTEIMDINVVRDEYSQRQNDYCDGVEFAKRYVLQIIDKYEAESEEM
jgi:arginyl-tRNA--protein-N-Asp/Glu arginylyltransferase